MWPSKEGKVLYKVILNKIFLNTGKLHNVFSLVPTYDSIMKAEFFLVCFKNAEMKRFCVISATIPLGSRW